MEFKVHLPSEQGRQVKTVLHDLTKQQKFTPLLLSLVYIADLSRRKLLPTPRHLLQDQSQLNYAIKCKVGKTWHWREATISLYPPITNSLQSIMAKHISERMQPFYHFDQELRAS
jgi:hypothetical protein